MALSSTMIFPQAMIFQHTRMLLHILQDDFEVDC